MKKSIKKQLSNIAKWLAIRIALIPIWPTTAIIGLVAALCIIILLMMPVPSQAQIKFKGNPVIDLGLSIKNESAAYKPFAWPKLVGYSLAGFGGLKDGLVEGFEFDGRKSWERKLRVSPYSQRGSESWRSVYIDGNPDLGFKSGFHKWMGAWDWYHRNDDYRKFGYITGGVMVGIGGAKTNTKWWHYAIDFGVSWAVSATTKSIGMKYIRN